MERSNVPIHLVFRRNAKEGVANLSLIERITRESLESNPGPVGIFTEAADITTTEADFFQSQIQKGISPSDSVFSTVVRRYPKLLRGMLFWLYRSDYVVFDPNSFRSQQLRLLDTLSQDYPRRILPILERATEDDVKLNWLAGMLQKDIISNQDLQFDPDNPDLHPAALSVVEDMRRTRQGRIAEVIQKTVSETDLTCLVGHLFITNHRVGIHLERAGFAVNRYFASA